MFTLQYPPGESSGSVVLPNPELGDSKQIDNRQVLNRTRTGEILSIYDSWNQTTKHTYNFTLLTDTQASDLLDFFETTAGLLIRIIDHYSRSMDGYIVTPTNQIITANDTCGKEATFEFEED